MKPSIPCRLPKRAVDQIEPTALRLECLDALFERREFLRAHCERFRSFRQLCLDLGAPLFRLRDIRGKLLVPGAQLC